MSILYRILVFLLCYNTLVFSKTNVLQKCFVKNHDIHFSFAKAFDESNIKHFVLKNPQRHVYDFHHTKLAHKNIHFNAIPHVRIAQYKKNIVRVVVAIDGYKPSSYQPIFFDNEYRISLPTKPKKKKRKVKEEASGFSLSFLGDIASFGNSHKSELIVIDAGHGGHDSGAVGGGEKEKDVVLQIAKRLEKELKKRGHPVYMTRKKDYFLKLRQRTKFADKKKAVVFVSIHANSVPKHKRHRVHGVETYFLQKTRDAKSQRIAARENKSLLEGTTKLSRSVIIDSVLAGPKIVESNKLAIDVHSQMIKSLKTKYTGVKDNGVRHAPFWVLVGASRPSILVRSRLHLTRK
ncbi:MAG: N-acetylmuramoyl-L-alanine amidase [Sulfurovum sp.]|nr:N-acetylmuramoyl-L-alanine amidase [Sulfurovum sp.]